MEYFYKLLILSTICVLGVVGPPVNQKKTEEEELPDPLKNLGYARYLREVVEALETDKKFSSKLANASEKEIKSGGIAKELEFVSHDVRNRLDELKRQEVDRIRHLIREQDELSHGVYSTSWNKVWGPGLDRKQVKIPSHLDHTNQHTFEIRDLQKLIQQATKDIAEVDAKRRGEFKNYEMEKEMERQEQLRRMDEEHRKKAQEEYEQQLLKHKEHPKLHHPGTKEQFKEVWQEEDQLPGEEFNLKTFFRMHDVNTDGNWDQEEIKAIFKHELDKMYGANHTEDDMRERIEEMERMREHVVRESDKDGNGLVSYQEFVEYSNRREYEEDPGWKGIDEEPQYTKEEYEEYEKMRRAELANLAAQGINPWGGVNYMPDGDYPPMPPHMQGQLPPGYHPDQQMPPNYHPNQQLPPNYQQMPPHQQQQQYQQVPQHHQQQQYQQVPPHQQQQQYQQVPPQHQQQQYQQVPPQHQQQQQVPQQQQQQQQQKNQVPVQNQQLPPAQETKQVNVKENEIPVDKQNPVGSKETH